MWQRYDDRLDVWVPKGTVHDDQKMALFVSTKGVHKGSRLLIRNLHYPKDRNIDYETHWTDEQKEFVRKLRPTKNMVQPDYNYDDSENDTEFEDTRPLGIFNACFQYLLENNFVVRSDYTPLYSKWRKTGYRGPIFDFFERALNLSHKVTRELLEIDLKIFYNSYNKKYYRYSAYEYGKRR
jgi:hypothetical protein